MTERTYYHDLGDEIVPDHEAMVAYLLDESVLFCGNSQGTGTIVLYILINDYFIPAADGETLPLKDVAKLYELYKSKSWDGVCEYVAEKRGIPNKSWREKYEEEKNQNS